MNVNHIQHVIASCPKLSTSMYLPLRHGKVAKVVYEAIIDCKNQKKGIVEIYNEGNKEIWWDKKITTMQTITFKTQQTRHYLLE